MSGMSKKSIKTRMTPSKSGSFSNNFKRDRDRDFKSDVNPRYLHRSMNNGNKEEGPAEEQRYNGLYSEGFPTQWGQMSGPMPPLQDVNSWQLNPAQIDAMMAYGNGTPNMQGLPAAGSFLARLAALRQGGRDGA